ncbi:hypothetical protein AC1031_006511 [Aphanomyces cochlioides]|nr:hypothetical protein AC1031_006511 [Aphanomyces cochlioides]
MFKMLKTKTPKSTHCWSCTAQLNAIFRRRIQCGGDDCKHTICRECATTLRISNKKVRVCYICCEKVTSESYLKTTTKTIAHGDAKRERRTNLDATPEPLDIAMIEACIEEDAKFLQTMQEYMMNTHRLENTDSSRSTMVVVVLLPRPKSLDSMHSTQREEDHETLSVEPKDVANGSSTSHEVAAVQNKSALSVNLLRGLEDNLTVDDAKMSPSNHQVTVQFKANMSPDMKTTTMLGHDMSTPQGSSPTTTALHNHTFATSSTTALNSEPTDDGTTNCSTQLDPVPDCHRFLCLESKPTEGDAPLGSTAMHQGTTVQNDNKLPCNFVNEAAEEGHVLDNCTLSSYAANIEPKACCSSNADGNGLPNPSPNALSRDEVPSKGNDTALGSQRDLCDQQKAKCRPDVMESSALAKKSSSQPVVSKNSSTQDPPRLLLASQHRDLSRQDEIDETEMSPWPSTRWFNIDLACDMGYLHCM